MLEAYSLKALPDSKVTNPQIAMPVGISGDYGEVPSMEVPLLVDTFNGGWGLEPWDDLT